MTTPLQFLAGAKALQGEGASLPVQLSGSSVEERLTESDLVDDELTLGAAPAAVRIWNRDAMNDGEFTINGIVIDVPALGDVTTRVGGTPSATVTVAGSTSFVLWRLS